jgi:hypothetical protein
MLGFRNGQSSMEINEYIMMSVSYNNKYLAMFTDTGVLWIGSSDLQVIKDRYRCVVGRHNFRFLMSLSLSSNSLYRQTTDCTEGGGLTREHCISKFTNVCNYLFI